MIDRWWLFSVQENWIILENFLLIINLWKNNAIHFTLLVFWNFILIQVRQRCERSIISKVSDVNRIHEIVHFMIHSFQNSDGNICIIDHFGLTLMHFHILFEIPSQYDEHIDLMISSYDLIYIWLSSIHNSENLRQVTEADIHLFEFLDMYFFLM